MIKKPVISSSKASPLSYIALKGGNEPFLSLPAPAELDLHALTTKAIDFGIYDDAATAARCDTYRLPDTKDRENYHGNDHIAYWLSGLKDFLALQRTAASYRLNFDTCRYFELGCASGRVLRHVACQSQAEVWCSDINLRHLEWIRLFLPDKIKLSQNTVLPQLPITDNYFDLITAFSVFTHIDDFEFAWLQEIRRILKIGGLAYLTFQSDTVWETYKHGWIKDTIMPLKDRIADYRIDDGFFDGHLPAEKTVFWWPLENAYNCTVFHHTNYIRKEWGRFFEIVEIIPFRHIFQDVVLLRRPN